MRQLRLLWSLLRVILVGLVGATLLLTLSAIPIMWRVATVPTLVLGVAAAVLVVVRWKMVWVWLVLLVEALLFLVALIAVVLGIHSEAYVPVLLLAFTMILASEHAQSTCLSYSSQFSSWRNIGSFNVDALAASLRNLYRRLARDSIVLAVGYVLSLAVATFGAIGPGTSLLSDPSLYAVIVSISLAALITLREE